MSIIILAPRYDYSLIHCNRSDREYVTLCPYMCPGFNIWVANVCVGGGGSHVKHWTNIWKTKEMVMVIEMIYV